MKTFEMAGDDVTEVVAELLRKYYDEHVKVGLKVDVLMVSTDDENEPALKHQGYAAAGVARILGPKERTAGRGDAEIVLDAAAYEEMSDEERSALLHHELHHFELVRDKNGRPKRDFLARPKLKMRLHDHQFGWFDEIARIHKQDSMEVQQAQQFYKRHTQLYFDFGPASKAA